MIPLRLFLADDHEIVRYGLRSLLESQFAWRVVGEAADGQNAIQGVLALEPDIAVMDVSMPVIDGLQATRSILSTGSRTKILILSLYESKEVIREIVDSGALGYVLKSDAARDLIAAVEAIRAGRTFFTSKTAEVILERHLKRMHDRAEGLAPVDKTSANKKGTLPL
jgi:DNA-binding NarL/FixJ family response regulator